MTDYVSSSPEVRLVSMTLGNDLHGKAFPINEKWFIIFDKEPDAVYDLSYIITRLQESS